jgi:two-component system, OmpR family, alkaline phosphatase synthesis response regulator PhoP
MSNQRILAVDDEDPILELIRYNLEKDGFRVMTCRTGEDAVRLARSELPDLVILDLMLPGMSGLDVCRKLKESPATQEIPVIMATAKTEDTDIVIGLELGADDYVTKPFSPKVLAARVRTVLRRKNRKPADIEGSRIELHGISIDPERHEMLSDGKDLALSATEFQIFEFLARNPGRVFSRSHIISAVKGSAYPVTERSIDVQILSIRKKLGEKADILETVRGIGYRMKDSE